jgi:signal recognition particle subunit SRP19
MVLKDENKYVIWPHYFDKDLSRERGRAVARKHAVDKPTSEQIVKAAQSLGLHPVFEKEKTHPRFQWKKEGRILIDKKQSKQQLLKQISNRL